ncbi:thiol-disulfide oxidoreductase DCC family protein [Roseibium limicola]|uniref:DUF393 domain-containing protein n=1 Tax=Roseibium limicola TaxID=2816037 RepID=A0A939ENY0_9HYPH|nr:DCC1-like thiol-disulfide oxidoreductase family protein [Roseibium limicola]MBO0346240.1 DUF393 domain-containing protein [Roseibium limicola]
MPQTQATKTEIPASRNPVLIFDAECVLCGAWVGFILRHERHHEIRFASSCSVGGRQLAGRFGFTCEDLERTFLLIENNQAFTRSEAALAVAAHLKAPVSWLRLLMGIPSVLRNAVYDLVARNRYRWFGHKSECFIPTPDQRARFLDL